MSFASKIPRFGVNLNRRRNDENDGAAGIKRISHQHNVGETRGRAALGDVTNRYANRSEFRRDTKPPPKRFTLPQPAKAEPHVDKAASSSLAPTWSDIDVADANNPFAVVEYVEEIYTYLRQRELQFRASPSYMSRQADITPKMRSILLDWLVEVHGKFRLANESVFLCAQILDRFLSKKSVTRNKLQLVGITALLVASKMEEIYTPEVNDFVYICNRTCSRAQILQMERLILGTLGFNMSVPTSTVFIKRYAKAAQMDTRGRYLAQYIAELNTLNYGMIKFNPSVVGLTAVHVACKQLGIEPWSPTLEHYSGYKQEDIAECFKAMESYLSTFKSTGLQAIERKYKGARFMRVASLLDPARK